ncbi:MAG: hypothetical protein QXG12_07265 [Thermoproteota archaeon]
MEGIKALTTGLVSSHSSHIPTSASFAAFALLLYITKVAKVCCQLVNPRLYTLDDTRGHQVLDASVNIPS